MSKMEQGTYKFEYNTKILSYNNLIKLDENFQQIDSFCGNYIFFNEEKNIVAISDNEKGFSLYGKNQEEIISKLQKELKKSKNIENKILEVTKWVKKD